VIHLKNLASTRQLYITGGMRAGKTTTALYLESEYGLKKLSIADKLKELYFNSHTDKKKNREWLQRYGSAARKTFGEDFWVDELIKGIGDNEVPNITIDDVRYQNELDRLVFFSCDLIEDCPFSKFLILHIDCPIDIQIERGAEIHLMNHKSELLANRIHNQVGQNYGYPSLVKLAGKSYIVYAIDGSREVEVLYEQIDSIMRSRLDVRS
jgi:dephospho-CoA kinase